jgi:hypothetical protein
LETTAGIAGDILHAPVLHAQFLRAWYFRSAEALPPGHGGCMPEVPSAAMPSATVLAQMAGYGGSYWRQVSGGDTWEPGDDCFRLDPWTE